MINRNVPFTGFLMKGLQSPTPPTLITKFRFQFSEKGETAVSPNKGPFIHSALTFRDKGENKHKV